MIKVRCRCGFKLKVKDSAAGRRIKCPDCGNGVQVPEPEDDFGDEYGYEDDYEDDYDDGYGDEDNHAPSPPKRRSSRSGRNSSGRGKGRKKSKSSDGLPMPVVIGGVALFAILVVGGAILAVYEPDPAAGSNDVAQDDLDDVEPPNVEPRDVTEPGPDARAPAEPVGQFEGIPEGELWIVLSNMRVERGGFGTTIHVDYRVAQGRPQSSKKYSLLVVAPDITGEKFIEYDEFTLKSSGSIQFQAAPTFAMTGAGSVYAYMGVGTGFREWDKVSGEAKPGQSSAAERPSAAVAGVLIALSNAKVTSNIGSRAVSVDVLLQGTLEAGKRYFLTIEGSGPRPGWQVEIGSELRTARQGQAETVSARLLGYSGVGALKLTVEKRSFGVIPGRGEAPEVVSNTLTVQ